MRVGLCAPWGMVSTQPPTDPAALGGAGAVAIGVGAAVAIGVEGLLHAARAPKIAIAMERTWGARFIASSSVARVEQTAPEAEQRNCPPSRFPRRRVRAW